MCLLFSCEKMRAFSSLVDSRRIVATHTLLGALSSWFFFLFFFGNSSKISSRWESDSRTNAASINSIRGKPLDHGATLFATSGRAPRFKMIWPWSACQPTRSCKTQPPEAKRHVQIYVNKQTRTKWSRKNFVQQSKNHEVLWTQPPEAKRHVQCK